jgi:hypothetical protein
MYIGAGNDPYELLDIAFEAISKKMGTFRTRKEKLTSPGVDSFGFCTVYKHIYMYIDICVYVYLYIYIYIYIYT